LPLSLVVAHVPLPSPEDEIILARSLATPVLAGLALLGLGAKTGGRAERILGYAGAAGPLAIVLASYAIVIDISLRATSGAGGLPYELYPLAALVGFYWLLYPPVFIALVAYRAFRRAGSRLALALGIASATSVALFNSYPYIPLISAMAWLRTAEALGFEGEAASNLRALYVVLANAHFYLSLFALPVTVAFAAVATRRLRGVLSG